MHIIQNTEFLDMLGHLEKSSVDLVIADPPYMLGAASAGSKKRKARPKCGNWADIMNASLFYQSWLEMARAALRPTGYVAMFGNRRSIPTYIKAFSDLRWTVNSCLVRDKAWIGPGPSSALRPKYEIILIAGGKDAKIHNRSLSDVIEHKWMAGHMGKTGHPAEKPVGLLQWLIATLLPPDGDRSARPVVDPFAGSGSVMVAALKEGCRSVSCESDALFYDIAVGRVPKTAVILESGRKTAYMMP